MDIILILLQRVNVLIPSYTIHFSRSGRHRPLGIAYAEFKTPEQIESVIKEFDGHVLKNRKIAVKSIWLMIQTIVGFHLKGNQV